MGSDTQGISGLSRGKWLCMWRPGGEDHSVGTLLDLWSKQKHNQMPVFQEHAAKETHLPCLLTFAVLFNPHRTLSLTCHVVYFTYFLSPLHML